MNHVAASAEYVVNYGRAGAVGRFANPFGLPLQHGAAVVVRSGRGDETGVVKSETITHFAVLIAPVQTGEIVREMSAEDRAQRANLDRRAADLIPDLQNFADDAGIPLTILDAEFSLSGDTIILQILPAGNFDPAELSAQLESRHGIRFILHDLSHDKPDEPEKEKGCGKPGCGSEGDGGGCSSCGTGGGCSTGSCSKGKVASAAELTDYFSKLRQQMERSSERVALH